MSNKKTAVIDFFSEITEHSAQRLISVVTESILALESNEIIIRLSSCGGKLSSAFSVYNFLRLIDIPLTIYNTGNVESSAILLYLAGDTRIAVPHSKFLIRPLNWTFESGPVYIPSLKEALISLDYDARRYTDIFNERTSGAEKPIDISNCLYSETIIIGTDTARSCGITTADFSTYTLPVKANHAWIVE